MARREETDGAALTPIPTARETRRHGIALYALAVLSILAFSAGMVVSLQKLGETKSVLNETRETGTWVAFGAELEFRRFMRVLARYSHGEQGVDHQDLVDRFDILWSRIPLPLSDVQGERLRATDWLPLVERDIQEALREVEPAVMTLKRGDLETYEAIRSRLEEFGPRLHDILTRFEIRLKDEISLLEMERLYTQLFLSFIGIMAGGGAIVFLLVAELRRTARLSSAYRYASIEAEAANRAKSEFLARMTHELRTPLNAVIGYSEMLCEDAREHGYKDIISDLERIRASGTHLLSMINDTLDLSRIETGRLELYPEFVDIEGLVEEVAEAVQPLIRKNNNTYRFEVADVGHLYIDATKLRQILFNLLSNAGKFTHDGSVELSVAREKEFDGSDWIRFTVRDNGIGIPFDKQTKVFDAFEQADASTTRQYGGSGLGLAVALKLTELMGGRIDLESTQGSGTTFTLRLPAPIKESQPGEGGTESPATLAKFRASAAGGS